MTVGIVVVSHSRALAEAAVALADEMIQGRAVRVEIAAGLDDGGFGTDAVAIGAAITRAETGAGVVVLMDLGSAVLSAELALELLPDADRERVVLCPAPLVEGLIVATVTAGGGAPTAEVAAEATAALTAKQAHLGSDPVRDVAPERAASDVTATFTVSPPHGLHARPAALLVQAVRGFDADVTVANLTLGTPPVPAGSLSKVATLGALRGHEVRVRASGPQAGQAVRALLDLARDGFGEAEPPAPAAAARPATVRQGSPMPASPGVGIGPARLRRAPAPGVADEEPSDAQVRRARLQDALDTVRGDLRLVRARVADDVGAAEAAVFDAHLLLLDDPDLLGAVDRRITAGGGAAGAWAECLTGVERELAGLPDPYQRARAADVRDVRDQVLRRLGGGDTPEPLDVDGVLVAPDLTPAEAVALDPARTTAVVLAGGSPTAHSAILLRARGIPAVVGAGDAVLAVAEGTPIAVDGTTAEIVIDPDEATRTAFRDRAEALSRRRRDALARAGAPATTVDGTTVLVGANVGSVADAAAAVGADLAGLVRTEFCFLGRAEAPTVDEQEAAYRAIAEAMGGQRITLRTLDVGGDKPLDYLPLPKAANPFLGVRGIRLARARPEFLTDQLVAIVRVAHDHPVDVLFPMVSTVDELLAARGLLVDAVTVVGRGQPDGLRVGIMVEIPAAALKAAAFAAHVDFLSIGTNDLTQYTMAAERGNDEVAYLADPLDPGVLALVAATAGAAGADLPVAVCGELAADVAAVPLLLGLGVRELSVAPAAVALVKEAVRAVDLAAARDLAAQAVAAPDAATVRALATTSIPRSSGLRPRRASGR